MTQSLIQRLQSLAKEIRELPGADLHGKRSQAESHVYAAVGMLNDWTALQQQMPEDSNIAPAID